MVMTEELAEIKAIEDGTVWIETRRKSTCGSCQMKNGCGSGILAQYFSDRAVSRLAIKDNRLMDIAVGDTVVVGMPEAALSKGAFITYMFPLLGMLLMAILAGNMAGFNNDGAVLLGGIIGFCVGFVGAKRFACATRVRAEYSPVILRKKI